MSITLPSKVGCDLEFKAVSGDLSCGREMRLVSKQRYAIGDAYTKMEVETISGSIEIR